MRANSYYNGSDTKYKASLQYLDLCSMTSFGQSPQREIMLQHRIYDKPNLR